MPVQDARLQCSRILFVPPRLFSLSPHFYLIKNGYISTIAIAEAKAKGASFRTGPELEICGYGCNDHFLEPDTIQHSFEVLADIIKNDANRDIVVDIGMQVLITTNTDDHY